MDVLTIAAGTAQELRVWDVRNDHRWAQPSSAPLERIVYYHHTADPHVLWLDATPEQQLNQMVAMAESDKFGLPYNFLVWPCNDHRVFYLNDIDAAWPHTYGHNGAVAIAAQGNYDEVEPPVGLAHRMGEITWALGTMWGMYLPEYFHRDVYPTACPGRYLAAALQADGSYSG